MLGLGLASSHAPAMFEPQERWPLIYSRPRSCRTAWITVAGAMQRRATVVDYIRAHHSKVGLAFAYWPGVEAAETGWAAAEAMLQERY